MSQDAQEFLDITHLRRKLSSMENRVSELEQLNRQLEDDLSSITNSETMRLSYVEQALSETKYSLDQEQNLTKALQEKIRNNEQQNDSNVTTLKEQLGDAQDQLYNKNLLIEQLQKQLAQAEEEVNLTRKAFDVQKKEIKALRCRNNTLMDKTLDFSFDSKENVHSHHVQSSRDQESVDESRENSQEIQETKILLQKIEELDQTRMKLRRDLSIQKSLEVDYVDKINKLSKNLKSLEDKQVVSYSHLQTSVPQASLDESIARNHELDEQNSSMTEEISRLKDENKNLKKHLENARNDWLNASDELDKLKSRFGGSSVFICDLIEQSREEGKIKWEVMDYNQSQVNYVLESLMSKVSLVPGILANSEQKSPKSVQNSEKKSKSVGPISCSPFKNRFSFRNMSLL
ncbi:hypothetical protein GEMRC1_007924 [Eukaryota sp. GEM-RC1]